MKEDIIFKQKPLSKDELYNLNKLLYRLYNTSDDKNSVYRVAKSLYTLMTNKLFSTDSNGNA